MEKEKPYDSYFEAKDMFMWLSTLLIKDYGKPTFNRWVTRAKEQDFVRRNKNENNKQVRVTRRNRKSRTK